MNAADDEDAKEREHRTFVNLLAAVVVLSLVVAGFWLLNFLDEKRKMQACLEAGRRDCLQKFDPVATPK